MIRSGGDERRYPRDAGWVLAGLLVLFLIAISGGDQASAPPTDAGIAALSGGSGDRSGSTVIVQDHRDLIPGTVLIPVTIPGVDAEDLSKLGLAPLDPATQLKLGAAGTAMPSLEQGGIGASIFATVALVLGFALISRILR
jgi:hypothetical protein